MEGKDKVEKIELMQVGDSGQENYNIKHDADAKFWSSLRKQVMHGPAVRLVLPRRGRS